MDNKVTLVARTFEDRTSSGETIRKDLCLIAGKAAGICYMPDDYLSEGIQNEEKSLKRSQNNAKSGHYSVYEHGSVSFIIETNKMMAMILNSTGLYSTSEKSARYTLMNPETELEKELYHKWTDIFKSILSDKYKDSDMTDKEIEKLSIENARYMISVFTPTVLQYSLPYNRAILLCGWLDVLADNMVKYSIMYDQMNAVETSYYRRLATDCKDLAEKIRVVIGITKEDHILDDHKTLGIELFSYLSMMYKIGADRYFSLAGPDRSIKFTEKQSFYADSYTSIYNASFAELAQAQRHRTLRYSIDKILFKPYVPNALYEYDKTANESYVEQWYSDYNSLIEAGVVPQATLLLITEQGRFEDFIAKCKERCCFRAQEEIRNITMYQIKSGFDSDRYVRLSEANSILLKDMVDRQKFESCICRCMFNGYTCKEPCKFIKLVNR